jgi:hypothetical protein
LQRWLLDYIEFAFQGTRLAEGLTIYEGESMAWYGDPAEDAKTASAERTDWRRVPVPDLCDRSASLNFLDDNGFRFYTPAIMSIIIRDDDERGLLTETFLYRLNDIRQSCRVRSKPFHEVYKSSQRAAIVRFVKYLIHNVPGGYVDDALVKTLEGLKCCSRR